MNRTKSPGSCTASRASRRGCYVCNDCKTRTIERISQQFSGSQTKEYPKFMGQTKPAYDVRNSSQKKGGVGKSVFSMSGTGANWRDF